MRLLLAISLLVLAISGTEACGRSPTKVINGDRVQGEPYPWMVYLHSEGKMCGGVLVDSSTVLTAAHCVISRVSGSCNWPCYQNDKSGKQQLCLKEGKMPYIKKAPEMINVHANAHNLNNLPEKFRRNARRVEIHPDYYRCDSDNPGPNDIAIIFLDKPLLSLEPVCIHDFECNQINGTLHIAGFGISAYGKKVPEDKLLEGDMNIMRFDNVYKTLGLYSTFKKQAAFRGDSGSGVTKLHDNGKWYLYGVVSGGGDYYSSVVCLPAFKGWLKSFWRWP